MNSEYLNSLTYDQARELYNQHGTSVFLKTLFKQNTHYNHTRLLDELSKLSNIQPLITNHQPLVTKHQSVASNQQQGALINRRRHLYRLCADSHAKLKALFLSQTPNIKASAPLALGILNNFDEIKNIWDVTNLFDTTGKLPDGLTVTTDGTIEQSIPKTQSLEFSTQTDLALNQEFNKHYKYITRYKNTATVAVELANRQSICHEIATELKSRGTFQYPNHNYLLAKSPKSVTE